MKKNQKTHTQNKQNPHQKPNPLKTATNQNQNNQHLRPTPMWKKILTINCIQTLQKCHV